MFIAHLPAGYIVGRVVVQVAGRRAAAKPGRIMATILVASILPDIDLLWFYLIDTRQHLHHTYWTHIPSFWLCTGLSAAVFAVLLRRRELLTDIGALVLGALLHLLLDTLAGGIYWLYPLSSAEFRWVEVPAVHAWWVANFLLHWTFGLELVLLATALGLKRVASARGRPTTHWS